MTSSESSSESASALRGTTGHLLDGITVLNLGSVGPAARAARMLADYGARVVMIAPVSKKGALQTKPVYHTYVAGRGFERMRVDLKADAGREALLRLVEQADVVIESYRPGVVDRLGIGWEAMRARNPGLVYCSTSGYGQDGPASTWAGHDINYLAMSGYLACSEPRSDGGPPIPGATIADSAGGGMQAVLAIMGGLVKRAASGEGSFLDVSAAEGILSLMGLSIDQYLATGEVAAPRQVLLTGRYAFYDLYEASDGKWVSVGAIEPHFYRNLCERLGHPEYKGDQYDEDKQDQIREDFRAAFKTRTRDEWTAELAPNDTCVAPVLTIPEVTQEPHWRERGIFMEAEHAEHGVFEQVAPILAGGVRGHSRHVVRLGDETDTRTLLNESGFSSQEISTLLEEGAVE
ncbi:MAG: carnitine dehydratase [Deltaproteobacteria bacterium]|nr:carnitine dehydratase [Deltaproteobacteria bacterium]